MGDNLINPVPEDRTVVSGVWSDVLDKWLDRLSKADDSDELKTALFEFVENSFARNNETMEQILIELRIANKHNEEITDEIFNNEDIDNDHS